MTIRNSLLVPGLSTTGSKKWVPAWVSRHLRQDTMAAETPCLGALIVTGEVHRLTAAMSEINQCCQFHYRHLAYSSSRDSQRDYESPEHFFSSGLKGRLIRRVVGSVGTVALDECGHASDSSTPMILVFLLLGSLLRHNSEPWPVS